MPLIRQKHRTDCGVAALAMLCNTTYEAADRAIPWRREGHLNGTSADMLRTGGLKLGYIGHGKRNDALKPITAPKEWEGREVGPEIWDLIPDNSLVKVPADDRNWHWVVWRKRKIWDPARGVFRPKDYDKVPTSYMQFKKGIN